MPDPLFENFDLLRPQRPPSERVPYISEKLDFWWFSPQKMTSIGYFGASDMLIRPSGSGSFFGEVRLRLQRPLRSMRLEMYLRPVKSLLWTSEPSRFLNSKILGLISLYFDVLRKKIEQNHENSCWILVPFLSEAVEAAWDQKSFKYVVDQAQIPTTQEATERKFLVDNSGNTICFAY